MARIGLPMSDPRVMREIDRLQRDLARLRAQVPVRVAPAAASAPVPLLAHIIGGNEIQPAGVDGIGYEPDDITDIPDYDPATQPATIDGIGVAWLVYQNEYVLVANFNTQAFFKRDYFSGQPVILGAPITLPVTDSDPEALKALYRIISIG